MLKLAILLLMVQCSNVYVINHLAHSQNEDSTLAVVLLIMNIYITTFQLTGGSN